MAAKVRHYRNKNIEPLIYEIIGVMIFMMHVMTILLITSTQVDLKGVGGYGGGGGVSKCWWWWWRM